MITMTYQKTIELLRKYENPKEGKYGAYIQLVLESALKERFTSIKKKDIEAVSTALKGDLISLEFEAVPNKPQLFNIVKVIQITKPALAPHNHAQDPKPSLPESKYDFREAIAEVKELVKENFGTDDYSTNAISAELLRERFSVFMEEKIQRNKEKNMGMMR